MAFPTGWGRSCALTIPGSGWFDSALTDFPVLFTTANLPSEMFDADGSYPARSDGGDIRFTTDSDGTTQIAREVVTFGIDNNPANGTAEIWVKVPSTSNSVTTTIYVWYNAPSETEPSASDTYGAHNAWDSHFKRVLHLQEAVNNTSNGYHDSTSNAGHMTGTSMALTEVAAKWGSGGKAQDFDGTADYIKGSGTSPAAGLNNLTVSAWVKSDSATQTKMIAEDGSAYNANSFYIYSDSGKVQVEVYFSPGHYNAEADTGSTISTSSFEHLALVMAYNTQVDFVRNGASVSGTASGSNFAEPTATGDQPLTLGSRPGGSHSLFYDGKIDEFRLSDTNRSTAWLKAEYSTGNAPTDVTVGTPSSPSGGSGNPWNYYAQAA